MVEFDNMNWDMCEGKKKIIDVSKRGTQEITKSGKFKVEEPTFTE